MTQKESNKICVISDDPIFISRIDLFAKNSNYTFEYQNAQLESTYSSIFLIDVNLLGSFLKKRAHINGIKFMVHGKQKDLKSSFNAGCIDFLRDPWTSDELEARISKIIGTNTIYLQWDNITISKNELSVENSSVEISIEEFLILQKMLDNKGEPVPREALLFTLKGSYCEGSRAVDAHISSLRQKLGVLKEENDLCCEKIQTVRGYGYLIY